MNTLLVILYGSTIFFLIISLLSLIHKPIWWLKAIDAARFYLLFFLLLLFISFLFVEISTVDYILLLLLLSFIVYQFKTILPFTFLHKPELRSAGSENAMRLSFFTANVRMQNTCYDKLIRLIDKYNPDVVLLTEVDQNWLDALEGLESIYTHHILHPQDNTYGMALYAKYPLAKKKVQFLVDEAVPSIHSVMALNENQQIQLLALHPRPPAPWTITENKDLELIYAAGITNWNRLPSVVLGDLNDVGWSKTTKQFKIVSQMLDPRIGRGFFNTYNAYFPLFRYPIDHIFVSRHFRLINMERLPFFGSDHFPIYLEVQLNF